MVLKNIALMLLCGVTLGACGHYSEDLASMDMPDSLIAQKSIYDIEPAAGGDTRYQDFGAYLAAEYSALAHQESKDHDHKAAALFTKKAKAAREGMDVKPSNYSEYDIAPQYAEKVKSAYDDLNVALEAKKIPENYAQLAKLQAQYDEFLEQIDEGHQVKDIKTCEENFYAALNALQAPDLNEINYSIPFPAGQTALDGQAIETLKEALATYNENTGYEFSVIGYNGMEEAGQDFNGRSMAALRAGNVRATLVQSGVPSYKVRAYTANRQALLQPASFSAGEPRVNIIMRLQPEEQQAF